VLDLQGYGWLLLEGLRMTILVSVSSMACALVMGLFAAFGKLSRSSLLRRTVEAYTTIVRGIPELVLLLLVYYGVPTLFQDVAGKMGFDVTLSINPFIAGISTLTIIYGAFACEVYRAAYLAVPRGQWDAAAALGLTRALALRKVVLPQMIRYALPGLGNVWMVLVKATALISVIQLPELMRNADVAARSTRMPFTFFLVAALLYLGITLISMWGQARLERLARRGIADATV
jgi:polar amino acid transport system permease protein/arginine/ornithine transport system permease protein